jgi:2-isopropylmalate synthase
MAVEAGASHIQGTINGLGERAGNADLCQVIPNLELKQGVKALKTDRPLDERLKGLREISLYVYELASLPPNLYQPYTGKFAFAHKAGLHVDGMMKLPEAYEHIDPELVSNQRLITISELSGKANIIAQAQRFGIEMDKRDPIVDKILGEVKELERKGYSMDDADASIYLLIAKHKGLYKRRFKPLTWRITTEKGMDERIRVRSVVEIEVNGEVIYEEATGVGPVNAQDIALRNALKRKYPEVEGVKLVNYKVSIIGAPKATASAVRVFIEFSNGKEIWATTSTSENILEASTNAIIEGYDYYFQRNPEKDS